VAEEAYILNSTYLQPRPVASHTAIYQVGVICEICVHLLLYPKYIHTIGELVEFILKKYGCDVWMTELAELGKKDKRGTIYVF
jgi:hypothetical protein